MEGEHGDAVDTAAVLCTGPADLVAEFRKRQLLLAQYREQRRETERVYGGQMLCVGGDWHEIVNSKVERPCCRRRRRLSRRPEPVPPARVGLGMRLYRVDDLRERCVVVQQRYAFLRHSVVVQKFLNSAIQDLLSASLYFVFLRIPQSWLTYLSEKHDRAFTDSRFLSASIVSCSLPSHTRAPLSRPLSPPGVGGGWLLGCLLFFSVFR